VATPNQLLRLLIELIFVFLGGLLIWVAFNGHYLNVDPRSVGWLLLAGLLVVYGLVTIRWRGPERAMAMVRGGSLVIVGLAMLALAHVRMELVTPLLIVAGVALAARGLIVGALVLRTAPKS
jgi:hypothetical protein